MLRDATLFIRTANHAFAESFSLLIVTEGYKKYLFLFPLFIWLQFFLAGAEIFWELAKVMNPVLLSLIIIVLGLLFGEFNAWFQRWFAGVVADYAECLGQNTFFVKDLVFLTVDSIIPVFLISGPVYYVLAGWLDLSFIFE